MMRAVTGLTLVLGWLFIFWQNNFNFTVPVVVIALGFLAVVMSISTLWRVGAAVVAPEDDSAGAWSRPTGARGELEKEKKTLLKAIKEAEFDQAMGKLSQQDADELIRMYRVRAVEVIKELERLDVGTAGSAREQIQREVAARLAVDSKSKKDKKKPAAKAKPVEVVTNPVVTEPVETDAVKTEAVETSPIHTNADDSSPEDRAASKSTEATS